MSSAATGSFKICEHRREENKTGWEPFEENHCHPVDNLLKCVFLQPFRVSWLYKIQNWRQWLTYFISLVWVILSAPDFLDGIFKLQNESIFLSFCVIHDYI